MVRISPLFLQGIVEGNSGLNAESHRYSPLSLWMSLIAFFLVGFCVVGFRKYRRLQNIRRARAWFEKIKHEGYDLRQKMESFRLRRRRFSH